MTTRHLSTRSCCTERSKGDHARLRWKVSQRDVGETCEIFIFLRVTGSKFNRMNTMFGIDLWSQGDMHCHDMVTFSYAVNPALRS